jgi:hypothetical protein
MANIGTKVEYDPTCLSRINVRCVVPVRSITGKHETVCIGLAEICESDAIVNFFSLYAADIRRSAVCGEFLCPHGVRAAIRRQQMLIGISKGKIFAAARFYVRKRTNVVSLYQFAVDESFRGNNLVCIMLSFLGNVRVEARCRADGPMSGYFIGAGWTLLKDDGDSQNWTYETAGTELASLG